MERKLAHGHQVVTTLYWVFYFLPVPFMSHQCLMTALSQVCLIKCLIKVNISIFKKVKYSSVQ